MDVSNIGPSGVDFTSGAGGVRPTAPSATTGTESTGAAAWESVQDEVQISAAGRMIDQLNNDPQARAERLAALREAIDSGVYETADKLERAMERMLESVLNAG